MWVVAGFKSLRTNPLLGNNATVVVYSRLFYYFIKPYALLAKGSFVYCSPNLIAKGFLRLGLEHTPVRFKYAGKAYRVSRRNKILHLNLHYPTFKYAL
jgi:hypothetical protein